MNLWLLAQEVAHIKRSTQKSILGLNGLIFVTPWFISANINIVTFNAYYSIIIDGR